MSKVQILKNNKKLQDEKYALQFNIIRNESKKLVIRNPNYAVSFTPFLAAFFSFSSFLASSTSS